MTRDPGERDGRVVTLRDETYGRTAATCGHTSIRKATCTSMVRTWVRRRRLSVQTGSTSGL